MIDAFPNRRSPDAVCSATLSLLDAALALDTGSVCDEGGNDFNISVDIILYVCRLASRVHNYIYFAVSHTKGTQESLDILLREDPPDDKSMCVLEDALKDIGNKLRGGFNALLDDYLRRCDAETRAAPEDESLISRNSRLACDLHAHKLLLFRNPCVASLCNADHIFDMDSATTVLGSFVYLTTRHTWNKSSRSCGSLLVPETELYELLCILRRKLVAFASLLKQGALDSLMQKALLEVSSTSTGSQSASSSVVDSSNR